MPPKVALILCAIFVLFLLRLDRKQFPEASLSLWIPTIWFLLVTSKPLGVWLGSGGATMEEGSALDRVLLIAVVCLGLLILSKRNFAWSSAIRENPWLILLIGYMLISVLWSDMPYTSFKRSTRQLIAVVMSFLIATEPEPRKALESILRRRIYVLIPFSFILIHYFPEHGREYHHWTGELAWCGIATQKNGLGLLCLSAAFFLIWSLIRRRQGRDIPATGYQTYLDTFILILTFLLMGGPQHSFSYSATSNATFILVLSAFIGLSWMKKRGTVIGPKALIVIVAFIIGYGTVTPFIGKLCLADISSAFGRDETLTGRSEIWATLIPFAMKRPIGGHGFGGFWTDATRALTSSHAHNGYLDVVLNIGFFGLFLFAMFLLSCCRRAQREMTQNFDWGILFICYLLMAVVHNIVESSSVGITGKFSAVVLIMAVSSTAATSNNQMVSRKV